MLQAETMMGVRVSNPWGEQEELCMLLPSVLGRFIVENKGTTPIF